MLPFFCAPQWRWTCHSGDGIPLVTVVTLFDCAVLRDDGHWKRCLCIPFDYSIYCVVCVVIRMMMTITLQAGPVACMNGQVRTRTLQRPFIVSIM